MREIYNYLNSCFIILFMFSSFLFGIWCLLSLWKQIYPTLFELYMITMQMPIFMLLIVGRSGFVKGGGGGWRRRKIGKKEKKLPRSGSWHRQKNWNGKKVVKLQLIFYSLNDQIFFCCLCTETCKPSSHYIIMAKQLLWCLEQTCWDWADCCHHAKWGEKAYSVTKI